MVLVTLALGFALTWIFGYKEEEVEAQTEVVAEDIASAGSAPVALQAETIAAPLKGEVVALENVNDPVFSSGAMGKGSAIKPSGNRVVAPFDGEVQIAFPTGHAYGLKSDKGAEVLIHIGIDTVSLDGKGFDAKVQANQRVKKVMSWLPSIAQLSLKQVLTIQLWLSLQTLQTTKMFHQ